jgi:hypothetical protein
MPLRYQTIGVTARTPPWSGSKVAGQAGRPIVPRSVGTAPKTMSPARTQGICASHRPGLAAASKPRPSVGRNDSVRVKLRSSPARSSFQVGTTRATTSFIVRPRGEFAIHVGPQRVTFVWAGGPWPSLCLSSQNGDVGGELPFAALSGRPGNPALQGRRRHSRRASPSALQGSQHRAFRGV